MNSNKSFLAKNVAKCIFGVAGGIASLLLLVSGSNNIGFASGVDTLDSLLEDRMGKEKYSETIDPLKKQI